MDASTGSTTPGDPTDAVTAREDLIGRIVGDICRRGYHVAHLDPRPEQDIIDLQWAAQMARRALGRRTRCHTSPVGAEQPGKITIVVALAHRVVPASRATV